MCKHIPVMPSAMQRSHLRDGGRAGANTLFRLSFFCPCSERPCRSSAVCRKARSSPASWRSRSRPGRSGSSVMANARSRVCSAASFKCGCTLAASCSGRSPMRRSSPVSCARVRRSPPLRCASSPMAFSDDSIERTTLASAAYSGVRTIAAMNGCNSGATSSCFGGESSTMYRVWSRGRAAFATMYAVMQWRTIDRKELKCSPAMRLCSSVRHAAAAAADTSRAAKSGRVA
mmetsp:Transcript_25720/g.68742  ORF Transcript_25720/g.68742 Transcript_25720/m.68742 type:complete len:231 (-) Transcript_25720:33-725(-)